MITQLGRSAKQGLAAATFGGERQVLRETLWQWTCTSPPKRLHAASMRPISGGVNGMEIANGIPTGN